MNIDISGHHVELSDGLRNYVTEKFQKIERHFDKLIDVHVILSVEKLAQKAEAKVNGTKLHAGEPQGDLYAAIDGLIEQLDRQAVRHKDRTQLSNRS